MRVGDIMAISVATVTRETRVQDAAELMLGKRVSGLPVVDGDNRVVGLLSEGDLIRRPELGTARRRPRWLDCLFVWPTGLEELRRSQGTLVAQVMSTPPVTIGPEASLQEAVDLMEKRRARRLPVVDADGHLIGILARSDLVRALVLAMTPAAGTENDRLLREAALRALTGLGWWGWPGNTVFVLDGVAHLWGEVATDQERKTLRAAVQRVEGIREVVDHVEIDPLLGQI